MAYARERVRQSQLSAQKKQETGKPQDKEAMPESKDHEQDSGPRQRISVPTISKTNVKPSTPGGELENERDSKDDYIPATYAYGHWIFSPHHAFIPFQRSAM